MTNGHIKQIMEIMDAVRALQRDTPYGGLFTEIPFH